MGCPLLIEGLVPPGDKINRIILMRRALHPKCSYNHNISLIFRGLSFTLLLGFLCQTFSIFSRFGTKCHLDNTIRYLLSKFRQSIAAVLSSGHCSPSETGLELRSSKMIISSRPKTVQTRSFDWCYHRV